MAAIPTSYIAYDRVWTEGGMELKDRKVLRVIITVAKTDATAYGDGTNTIPAATFGLTKIEEVRGFIDNANAIVDARSSYDGANMLTYDLTQATDANRNVAAAMIKRIDANTPGVFYGVVIGVGG